MTSPDIFWEVLPAKYPCKKIRSHIQVYLQKDVSVPVGKDISFTLPIKFKIKSGAVVLGPNDRRLVPVSEVFLFDSEHDGPEVIFLQ